MTYKTANKTKTNVTIATSAATLAALFLASACAGEPDFAALLPPSLACDPTAPGAADPIDDVSFERGDMMCAGVEMDPAAFAQMARQSRFGSKSQDDIIGNALAFLSADCTSPAPDQFTWFAADLQVGGIVMESIKKRFLQRSFGDDTGSLYEGALVDFTDEYFAGFATGNLGRWEAKTDHTDPSGAPLQRILDAMDAPDDELIAALEPVLNVDRFIAMWALETLVNHHDGYAGNRNNFYIYFDPTDDHRATFVPWGVDEAMSDGSDDEDEEEAGDGEPSRLDTYTFAELPRRLSRIPAAAAVFEAELTRLVDEVWDEEALLASVDAYADQVRTAEDDPDYDAIVDEQRAWVSGRKQHLTALLAQGLPAGPPQARTCFALLDGDTDFISELLDWFSIFVFLW